MNYQHHSNPGPIVDQLPILEQESEDNDIGYFLEILPWQVAGYQAGITSMMKGPGTNTAYITEAVPHL